MPVTPNAWQTRARDVFDLYLDAELTLLRTVKRRLAKGIDRPGWAEQQYAEARAMRQEAETVLALLESEAAQLYTGRITGAYDASAGAAYADIRRAVGIPTVKVSAARIWRIDAVLDELRGKLTAQRATILRSVDDAYRRIIGYGIADMQAGSANLRQSVQRSLDAFAAAGITSFVDSAGRNWGMAEYAEMATRTGMMRASLAGYADAAIANGQDLIIVTDHSDECPLCTPWENAVLSLTGLERDHPDCAGTLAEAVDAGLFHPGCLHSFNVYIPGLTVLSGGDRQTPEQNARGYGNRQRERYMERQVRSWKRRQAAAIDPIDERRAKSYVDRWQANLRALTRETGLMRGVGREGPRVLLSAAAKRLHPVTPWQNHAIITWDAAQVGRKIGKHAQDWGLDPGNAQHRDYIKGVAANIVSEATEKRLVDFRQPELLVGYRKGNDVVLLKQDGTFVTLMSYGAYNARFMAGKVIK